MVLGADLKTAMPLTNYCFDRTSRQRLMAGQRDWPIVAEKIWEERIPQTADLLRRATQTDFENYFAEDILVKVDRSSMLNSLEVRAPLLDYRLIEFAFGKVPSTQKASAKSRKILLKKLAARLLPREFDQQRKQGFSIPLGSWLKSGPWQDFFRQVLLSSENTTFNRRFVETLLKGQSKGRLHSERLFGLVLFELWRREYHVSM
jgi:asparagine synthase (glutamine-hydrolysing)